MVRRPVRKLNRRKGFSFAEILAIVTIATIILAATFVSGFNAKAVALASEQTMEAENILTSYLNELQEKAVGKTPAPTETRTFQHKTTTYTLMTTTSPSTDYPYCTEVTATIGWQQGAVKREHTQRLLIMSATSTAVGSNP